MTRRANFHLRFQRRGGFTLVELLVVITIVLIVSVAAIAVVMPAVQSQGVSSGALLLQAELSRARDEAVRYNQPRGIRLLPDRDGPFAFPYAATGQRWGYSRMIALEPGPNYEEGEVRNAIAPGVIGSTLPLSYTDGPILALAGAAYNTAITPQLVLGGKVLWTTLWESKYSEIYGTPTPSGGQPRSPTSWYWNVRRGDKIRIGPQGIELTIVGPMLVPNPEGYINWGDPASYSSTPSSAVPTATSPGPPREFLVVLDGIDNDGDGYVDEAWDGLDNDYDGIIDPGFNGLDDDGVNGVDDPMELLWNNNTGTYTPTGGEWEPESIPQAGGLVNYVPVTDREAANNHALGTSYTILRRPLPAPKARELTLPAGVLIDMTTASPSVPSTEYWERSRLPVDWSTGYVDIMINPNGQIVSSAYAGRSRGLSAQTPFLHFWLADTDDVIEPDPTGWSLSPPQPQLPVTLGTNYFVPQSPERVLKGHRRLVSVNTRTGQITTATLESFDLAGLSAASPDTRAIVLSRPYRSAEAGVKEQP